MSFGVRLKTFIKGKNLTQRQLGKLVEMSPNTITQIVNGRDPTYSFIEKFIQVFPDVDMDYMIKGRYATSREDRPEYIASLQRKLKEVQKLVTEIEEMTRG